VTNGFLAGGVRIGRTLSYSAQAINWPHVGCPQQQRRGLLGILRRPRGVGLDAVVALQAGPQPRGLGNGACRNGCHDEPHSVLVPRGFIRRRESVQGTSGGALIRQRRHAASAFARQAEHCQAGSGACRRIQSSLILRIVLGAGTPRRAADRRAAACFWFLWLVETERREHQLLTCRIWLRQSLSCFSLTYS